MDQQPSKKQYESPALRELGTVHALTLGIPKHYGNSDGFTFEGQGITHLSN